MDINRTKPKPSEKKKEKKIEKAVKGGVKIKERTKPATFLRSLLAEDVKTIETHVMEDVVKPQLLEIIFNAFTDGLEMALFGSVARKKTKSKGYTSYGDYYKSSDSSKSKKRERSVSRAESRRTIYDLEELEFEYKEDAENVLDRMCDILQEYPRVTGADLCELLGRPTNYTDRKYGWTDLGAARIERIRGGTYVLSLPRAEVLE